MDIIRQLHEGLAWTAARVAAVHPDDLDAPTPCDEWDLRQLLNHTIGSLGLLTDAVAGEPATSLPDSDATDLIGTDPAAAFAALAARSQEVWQAPDVLTRTVEIPLGPTPAAVVARITLLEAVTHGWDISRATGEAADIPEHLAEPVLGFAREAVEGTRGSNFGADLGVGDTPSDRLVAFLGRKP